MEFHFKLNGQTMTDSARVWFTTELLTQSAETTLPIKTQNAAEKERADPHKPSEHSLPKC